MNNGPTLSKKLKSENRKYHSSIAVVLFVIFITVTISIFFLSIKSIFDNKSKEDVKTEETIEESKDEALVEPNAEEETIYIVESGDTLYSIGINLGVDWQEIAQANEIEAPYSLSTGQELIIPKSNNINNEEE